jgi:hypothetical protein
MKYFLICFCISLTIKSFGQRVTRLIPQPGKVFISQGMEDLEISNDSTLKTSIDEGHSYRIANDTLFIIYRYDLLGPNNSDEYKVEYHPYKIISANTDTIILEHHYKAIPGLVKEHDETFVFVNLEKYKQQVKGFKYLTMLHSSAVSWKSISVAIDSTGKVTYSKFTIEMDGKKKDTVNITGQFSKVEYERFKDILSLSLIKRLKPDYGCGIDPAPTDFIFADKTGVFTSNGCIILHLPQLLLFNYIYAIDTNGGIEWIKNK